MDNEIINFLSPTLNIYFNKVSIDKNSLLRDLHFHSAIELVRIDEGSLVCNIASREIKLNKNNILFINSNVIHRLICTDYAKFTYFQVNMDAYLSSMKIFETEHLYNFVLDNNLADYKVFTENTELTYLLNDIETEFTDKNLCYTSYIMADIYRIGAIMQRNGLFPNPEMLSSKKLILRLIPAIKYAEERFESKVYIEDVSRMLHMDKFYFCKLFKKAVGVSFVEYITFLRINKAQYMLSHTDKTVSEIASESGFNSVQYFNRLFKQKYNCTPKAYRKMKLDGKSLL